MTGLIIPPCLKKFSLFCLKRPNIPIDIIEYFSYRKSILGISIMRVSLIGSLAKNIKKGGESICPFGPTKIFKSLNLVNPATVFSL